MSLFSRFSPELKQNLVYCNIAIFLMLAIGTLGFHFIEGLSWLESIYATTTTVTTVGYGDVVPETQAGKVFVTLFILFSVGTVLYALSVLAQAFIHDELLATLERNRKTKEMENLSNHYIICGAGRVGRRIVYSLQKEKHPFVVLDRDENQLDLLKLGDKEYALKADATLEENLRTVGVERAKGIATCLESDAANVYVVLTARDLNKNLHIVSRAVEEQAEAKLIRAGANRVVAPTIIGGLSMSRNLTKPAIADFMATVVAENLDLVFEEVTVSSESKYNRKSLKETNISRELKVLIVAIRRKDGEMIFNPGGDSKILEGDLLVVVGKAEAMQKLIKASK